MTGGGAGSGVRQQCACPATRMRVPELESSTRSDVEEALSSRGGQKFTAFKAHVAASATWPVRARHPHGASSVGAIAPLSRCPPLSPADGRARAPGRQRRRPGAPEQERQQRDHRQRSRLPLAGKSNVLKVGEWIAHRGATGCRCRDCQPLLVVGGDTGKQVEVRCDDEIETDRSTARPPPTMVEYSGAIGVG